MRSAPAREVEGETGDEVFILMSGEAAVLLRDGDRQKLIGREKAGGFIGELAVLDPGPRPATVVAGDAGAHVLCLGGDAFRDILRSNPAVVGGVMRALASRLRETHSSLPATDTIRPQAPAENTASSR